MPHTSKKLITVFFQDLPAAGFNDVSPGEYRPPVPAGTAWLKHRVLSMNSATYFVAYSPMDDRAQSQIDAILAHAKPEVLGKLHTEDLARQLANLYTELDYLHPFSDGNSRTLRTFTRQLAREAGYELAWERFNDGTTGRDALYIARDHGVNHLAKRYVQHEQTLRRIIHSLARIKGNPSLQELVRGIIRPSRAIAFEQLAEAEAIREHPELKYAYDTLRAARHYISQQLASESDAHSAFETVRRHVQHRLDTREVQGFSRSGPSHAENRDKE